MENIYRQAVNVFGEGAQYTKALEELTELQLAIHRFLDGRGSALVVATEIVDVEIMCEQLRVMLPDGLMLVKQEKARKLRRLKGLIEVKREALNP